MPIYTKEQLEELPIDQLKKIARIYLPTSYIPKYAMSCLPEYILKRQTDRLEKGNVFKNY